MKKKTVVMLFCVMAALMGGCEVKSGSAEQGNTEAVIQEQETESVSSADIAYNVEDYVTLGDYSNIEVDLNAADYVVDDDAVNSYVDQMISNYKPYVADDTKTVVEKGDVVDVNYVGKKDGEAFDGGSADNTLIDTAQNAEATSGNGYIDGFSDGLIGAKVGETVDSEVTFPDDYGSEDLKGQTVTFTFTINSIDKKVTRDMLDDAFVKENFNVDTVSDFYDQAEASLKTQMEQQKESDIRTAVIDEVTKRSEVKELPAGLLDVRVQEYIANFEKQYCTNGTTLDDLLSKNNTTEEDFRNQISEYMQENLKQELVFEAVAKKENIEFDQDGFDTYMSNLMSNTGLSTKDDVYTTYGSSAEAGEKYLKKIYVENKACEQISDNATINYKEETQATESTESVSDTESALNP